MSKNYYKEPLGKDHRGNSRIPGDATVEVKEMVKKEIVEQAQAAGLLNRDVANLLAIADHESGFNPDAACKTSTASGVMESLDPSVEDAYERLSKYPKIIDGYKIKTQRENYRRFDYRANIDVGIAIYLDKKRMVRSSDVAKIYKKYNLKATAKLQQKLRDLSRQYLLSLSETNKPGKEPNIPRWEAGAKTGGRKPAPSAPLHDRSRVKRAWNVE